MRKAMLFARNSLDLPDAAHALPGRPDPIPTAKTHFVTGRALTGPYPAGLDQAIFALGCYWAGERRFWSLPGIHVTAAGNIGGISPNPTYEEVCTGRTGHAESVLVVYDPKKISYEELLRVFWESHDPTQGMRQGDEIGNQYRSAIYWTTPAQRDIAIASKAAYEEALRAQGYGAITTEIREAGPFYFAEAENQQYLAKDPNGPGGLGGTGVSCPIARRVAA